MPGVLSVHSPLTGAIHGRGGAQAGGEVSISAQEANLPRFGGTKAAATYGAKDEQKQPCCWAFPARMSRDIGEPGTVRLQRCVCAALFRRTRHWQRVTI